MRPAPIADETKSRRWSQERMFAVQLELPFFSFWGGGCVVRTKNAALSPESLRKLRRQDPKGCQAEALQNAFV